MIKFTCPTCQKKLGVDDVHAGKNIRCPQCGNPASVPNAGTSPSDVKTSRASTAQTNRVTGSPSRSTTSSASSGLMPRWVWGLLIGWVAIMVVSLVLYLALRDTWERDHYAEIKSLADQANTAVNSGNVKEGLETYDRLFQLVGPRVLKGATKDILDSAKASFPLAQEKYEGQLIESLTPMVEQATSLYRTSEFEKALDKYTQVSNALTVRPVQGEKIKQFLQSIVDAKQLTEKEVQKIQAKRQQDEAKRQAELAKAEEERKTLENQRKARQDAIRTNPSQAFKEFSSDFMTHLPTIEGLDVWPSYKVSLERTTNELMPYLGTVIFRTKHLEYRAHLALQDNRWDLRTVEWKNPIMDDPWDELLENMGMGYSDIKKGFEQTPNP